MRGARSIYVDYVDYDEIAHHAGSTRIESLAALAGLDQVLALLEKVAERAPRALPLRHAQRPRPVAGPALRRALGHRPLRPVCRADPTPRRPGSRAASRAGVGSTRSLEDLAGGDGGPGVQRAASAATWTASWGPAKRSGDDALIVLGERQPRAGLRPGARAPDRWRRSSRRWPAARPGPGRAPGYRLRRPALAWTARSPSDASGRHHLATGVVEGIDPLEGVRARTRRRCC